MNCEISLNIIYITRTRREVQDAYYHPEKRKISMNFNRCTDQYVISMFQISGLLNQSESSQNKIPTNSGEKTHSANNSPLNMSGILISLWYSIIPFFHIDRGFTHSAYGSNCSTCYVDLQKAPTAT